MIKKLNFLVLFFLFFSDFREASVWGKIKQFPGTVMNATDDVAKYIGNKNVEILNSIGNSTIGNATLKFAEDVVKHDITDGVVKGVSKLLNIKCQFENDECPNENVTFWFYTRSTENNPIKLNLKEPESLKSSGFIKNVPTKILIHGYTGHKDFPPNTDIRPAYFKKGEYNIISVDYNPIVRSPCYRTAAIKSLPLASKCTAQMIDFLVKYGNIPLKSIHVIGFSLGAHVSGQLNTYLKSGNLSRITGLDPAAPLLITANISHTLNSKDADFVDIIHTNTALKGKSSMIGDVDFYVNGGVTQPGCSVLKDIFVEKALFSCDHNRAPKYYAESILTKTGFYGQKCEGWFLRQTKDCDTNEDHYLIMGEHTPKNASGVYFLHTNSQEPFAKGKTGVGF